MNLLTPYDTETTGLPLFKEPSDPATGKRYLNITAGAEHELTGEWGEYGVKIEGADSFTNSRANTENAALTKTYSKK